MLSYFLYWFAELMTPSYGLLSSFLSCVAIACVIGIVRKLFLRGDF